jgi:hypothetical protein
LTIFDKTCVFLRRDVKRRIAFSGKIFIREKSPRGITVDKFFPKNSFENEKWAFFAAWGEVPILSEGL